MEILGRFAPTPSGRMHLGNVFAFLIAWLSAKSRGGKILLRMEDLDTQRTSAEYAALLRSDLRRLGLVWDWESEPQSARSAVYDRYFEQLRDEGLLYPCFCTRARLHGVNAPHLSDGTYVYDGRCRELSAEQRAAFVQPPSWRVRVPERNWIFSDLVQGGFTQDLAVECGDFVVRRADGCYVYQLAVTVDDGEAGVTEVVRGSDLLSSAPRQMYLQELFGFSHPQYAHVPLLVAPDGRRLSKRDRDLDLGQLLLRHSPEEIIGNLAFSCGLLEKAQAISAQELIGCFCWEKIKRDDIVMQAFV